MTITELIDYLGQFDSPNTTTVVLSDRDRNMADEIDGNYIALDTLDYTIVKAEESWTPRRSVPCLYVMHPIGVDGALESVDVMVFCSEDCRNVILSNTEHTVQPGMDSDHIPGSVCDECGEVL